MEDYINDMSYMIERFRPWPLNAAIIEGPADEGPWPETF